MELSVALGIPFGAAGWLALLLHTFAIECYVSIKEKQVDLRHRLMKLEKSFASRLKNPIACAKYRMNVNSSAACPGPATQA
jgi:hypothetical protein